MSAVRVVLGERCLAQNKGPRGRPRARAQNDNEPKGGAAAGKKAPSTKNTAERMRPIVRDRQNQRGGERGAARCAARSAVEANRCKRVASPA